ncbi:MAG TPA: hypothetical protein VMF05_00850 [Stellaceae bacterium]|nr:hypothetical protein [Stellaceae bacterium]
MRLRPARGLMIPVLLAAAATALFGPAAMAWGGAPASGRWQWLAHTYWYVPSEYLLALASSPSRAQPIPVSDQTVYYISNYADGYFWGITAVSYTGSGGSSSSRGVSCLQVVGSVTPEGAVHLTFTALDAQATPSGSSSSEPTIGIGTMTRQRSRWTMENQMSTVAAGNLLLTHWAYMDQCKPSEPCFAQLPGAKVSVPEFLSSCDAHG